MKLHNGQRELLLAGIAIRNAIHMSLSRELSCMD
jgi:hypothetical protein